MNTSTASGIMSSAPSVASKAAKSVSKKTAAPEPVVAAPAPVAAVAAPANNVGGGAMAGVSPGQDPPMPKSVAKKRKKMLKRQQDRITKDVKTLNIIDPSGQK